MKYLSLILAFMLLFMFGCADDGLLSALSDEEDGAGIERPLEEDLSLRGRSYRVV